MSFANEDFVEAVERAGVFNDLDAKSLQGIVKSAPFLRAARIVMRTVEDQRNKFLSLDFAKPEAALAASVLQGECRGMLKALDLLHELADFPEDEETKDAA